MGVDQLRTDIFYITPCSRRLRTFPEIQRYLQTRGITDLPLDSFTFSRKLQLGEEQDDQDEGGIKISRRGRKRATPLSTPTSADDTIAAMTTMTGEGVFLLRMSSCYTVSTISFTKLVLCLHMYM